MVAKLLNPETLEVVKTYERQSFCRSASISPFAMNYDKPEFQRFHALIAGGQDARDVTTTASKEGGFETRLFDMVNEEELARVTGHFGPVHSVAFLPNGRGFATGSEDGYVRFQHFPLEYYGKNFE